LKKFKETVSFALKTWQDKELLVRNQNDLKKIVGDKFEHLKKIYDMVENKSRLGVCLDTCHMFAAGYDISKKESYEKSMKEFGDVIGFDLLKVIHVNDSKKDCRSRLDRHECLGKGKIEIDAFKWLVTDERLSGIPMILETPLDEVYPEEIKLLKQFVSDDNEKKRKRDEEEEEEGPKKKVKK
jgi:deoxyribonuclease IV